MSDRLTDYQLALSQLETFTELAERRRLILIAAVRVDPDPGGRPLKNLEGRSMVAEASVRTRLVFDADGALVSDECIVNRKIVGGGRKDHNPPCE